MFRGRLTRASVALPAIGAVLVGVLAIARLADTADAQQTGGFSDMQQRLNQVIDTLKKSPSPNTLEDAIDDGMEILYGGLRPLPSKGPAQQQTEDANRAASAAEEQLAKALEELSKKNHAPPGTLDLKLFIEQMNEVAQAVGQVTRQCGQGDQVNTPPCDELHTRLNENNAQEVDPGTQPGVIGPGYTVKLRGPAIPRWSSGWAEDVRVTPALAPGECSVVVKETQGLMLRLRFQRITVVSDPWVSTFGVPRGTAVPIWTLEWIPSEYLKEINICNSGGGSITRSVTQHVVQDPALNYFWRLYPKDP